MSLEGRAALVTGAGRNIGRAVVRELARRGCNIAVNARGNHDEAEETAAAARELGVDAIVVLGDVGDAQAVRAVCARAVEHFGTVEVVINNAAIRPSRPFLEITAAEWDQVLAVDLDAAFHTAQACLPGMIERGFGRIVNFTGMNAIMGYGGRAHVSVAKHGVWGLTKALAKEFGRHGVTVNAISPGPIQTVHRQDPEMAAHIESQRGMIPVGRLGEPAEVAALCGFLASPEGAFVNGQMIAANGGAQT